MEIVRELIGIFGSGLILIAFVLNQTKKLTDQDFVYDFLNFLGSFGLVVYAFILKSCPFFILNSVWMLVSLRDCAAFIFSKHEKRS